MKIYDISQEVFSCKIYNGDISPTMQGIMRTDRGDAYNLTNFTMCAHNGTHIDAPFHFFEGGKTAEQIPLEKTVGDCYVVLFNGEMNGKDAEDIINKTRAKRILLRGDVLVTPDAARTFAEAEIYLIGVESQSVGDVNKPVEVHKILLSREIVLLEGIRLDEIAEGEYFLSAAPLALGGADGAPCRAYLIEK